MCCTRDALVAELGNRSRYAFNAKEGLGSVTDDGITYMRHDEADRGLVVRYIERLNRGADNLRQLAEAMKIFELEKWSPQRNKPAPPAS